MDEYICPGCVKEMVMYAPYGDLDAYWCNSCNIWYDLTNENLYILTESKNILTSIPPFCHGSFAICCDRYRNLKVFV